MGVTHWFELSPLLVTVKLFETLPVVERWASP
jgi:hypothetical protein